MAVQERVSAKAFALRRADWAGPGRAMAAGLALWVMLVPPGAEAQDVAETLSGSLTLYGWLPAIDGRVVTGRGGLSSSIGGSDVLEALDFGFMAAGDLQYGRVGAVFDVIYGNFSTDGTLSGPLGSQVDVGSSSLLATAALTYRVVENDGAWLDAMAGARLVDLEADLQVTGGGPIGGVRSASAGETWVDPLIGVRGRFPLTDRLSTVGFANIGGFGVGSQLTWDVFGGFDYAFSARFSGKVGFRYLSIEYVNNGREFDLDFYGPALGLTARF